MGAVEVAVGDWRSAAASSTAAGGIDAGRALARSCRAYSERLDSHGADISTIGYACLKPATPRSSIAL